MLTQLWMDDCGAVISAELALVLTIAVLAMVVGLSEVAVAVNTELNDVSNAIGHLIQTYGVTGFHAFKDTNGSQAQKSYILGSSWIDSGDDCDCNTSCDLVCGVPTYQDKGM